MTDKELRKLNRRELLKMLLVQCQETERLTQELKETKTEFMDLTERYDRLIEKLNVKDERLNQKDAQIAEFKNTIEEMKASREIELEEAGSIAEAALRINGVFEAAQRAAEQYLMNVKRLDAAKAKPPVFTNKEAEKRIPFESGWRAGIQRKGTQGRSRQMISMSGELHG
ncbi:hypothetical protein AALA78_11925 [Lachnospiraceae bacterium 42-17]|nr:hypothetical protein [Dorea sp.]